MGQGINMAKENNPEHARVIDDFKDQLLVILIKRLGGKVSIPVSECDDTGHNILSMKIIDKNFYFEIGKKH